MEVPMKTDAAARSDVDALTALNRDYIRSVQHGDVQRFEEILAEDFLCSNPDGSLVNKKQSWHRPLDRSRSVTSHRMKSECAFSAMSLSFTRAPATPRRMASSGMAAIRMSGRSGTESGLRYPPR